jgi:predicted amidophosphoribosyltransferase
MPRRRRFNQATALSTLLCLLRIPLLTALLPLLWSAMQFRLRRPPPGLCTDCGYNLTANTSGVCPECGSAISSPAVVSKDKSPRR